MKPAPEMQSQPAPSTPEEPPLVRLEARLLDALAEDFDKHGREVVEKVRMKSPDVYLRVVAAVLCDPAAGLLDPLAGNERDEARGTVEFMRRVGNMTKQ